MATDQITSVTNTIPAAVRQTPPDYHERVEAAADEAAAEHYLPPVLMQPGETLDQCFLRLAIERLQSAAERIQATVAADRHGAGWGHLCVAANEMRAALAWLVAIGSGNHDRPQGDLSYEPAEPGNEVTA